MSDKVWFRYEADFALRWCPVVVWSEDKPRPKKHFEHLYSAAHEVPPECIGEDGEPCFGMLQERFHAPQEKEEG